MRMAEPKSFPGDEAVYLFILHWNRPQECLQTISRFTAQITPLHVTVIDNGSTPAHLQELAGHLPAHVHLVRLPQNEGWGGGFNPTLQRWLSERTAEFCIVSAHDALPGDNCIPRLIAAMKADPAIGIACPEYGGGEWPLYSPILGPRYTKVSRPRDRKVDAVDFPLSTLVIFRRSCLLEIGLYDPRFFAYGDEVEIGLRARRFGWKVALVWEATVVNPGSWTGSDLLGYLWTRNSMLLALLYGNKPSACVRAAVVALRGMFSLLQPPRAHRPFRPGVRFAALRDFLLRRFGRPPSSFFQSSAQS